MPNSRLHQYNHYSDRFGLWEGHQPAAQDFEKVGVALPVVCSLGQRVTAVPLAAALPRQV